MPTDKNYYELLGVARTASTEEIKVAYREISRIFHPDSNFFGEILGEESRLEDSEMFQELGAVYKVLSNPDSRAAYDATLAPELRDWDSDAVAITNFADEESAALFGIKPVVRKPVVRTTAGKFGSSRIVDSDEDSSLKSVFEIVRERKGLWRRLCSILGVARL